jgi:hypothetical protein
MNKDDNLLVHMWSLNILTLRGMIIYNIPMLEKNERNLHSYTIHNQKRENETIEYIIQYTDHICIY